MCSAGALHPRLEVAMTAQSTGKWHQGLSSPNFQADGMLLVWQISQNQPEP